MEAFLGRILSRYGYRIVDSRTKNWKTNLADFVLALLYTSMSVYNAFGSINDFEIRDQNNNISMAVLPTLFLIATNLILLIRLHIKHKLRFSAEIENVSDWLQDCWRYDDIIDYGINLRISGCMQMVPLCLSHHTKECGFRHNRSMITLKGKLSELTDVWELSLPCG